MLNKYSFKFTPAARQDLIDIFNYIEKLLYSPKAAKDLMDKIDKAIENICLFPFAASMLDEDLYKPFNFRKIPIDNYILYYEINEEKKQVNILRVQYAKRDHNLLKALVEKEQDQK